MADGLTTQSATLATIPDATKVATDDAGSPGHVQIVKLAEPTDGSATPWGDAAAGLPVEITNPGDIGGAGPTTATQAQTSAGLTTASTAYTAGDQLGTILTFTSMVATSGGNGRIRKVVLVDAANVTGAIDLFLFRETVTLASDNAAGPAVSDADALKCCGIIQLPPPILLGNNRVAALEGVSIPFDCTATSLFVGMVTRSGHTFFGATSDLTLRLYYETS